jgi:pimeloyl-ACP methyl ester carboxylesterase
MREDGQEHATARAPRTWHEETIRRLVAEALAISPDNIGIDADFFAAGGRSAPAEQLATLVGETFGIEVPVSTIHEQATVERMGLWVEEQTKRPPQGRPLALRPSGGQRPLFCIHPSSGFGRPYRVLLPYLAVDMPVYALEARGVGDGDTLPATLDEMSADYIDQIREIQPDGPYRLLGWSFGAIPAHAIATAMQRRGLQVGSLVLIDGFPFDGEPWVEQLVSSHRDHWGKEMLSFREVREASDERKSIILDRLCAIKRNNVHLQSYKGASVFEGDALLVSCGPHPFSWADHVSGKLLEISVPFGHNVLMTPEAAAFYGPGIDDYLGRA